MSISRKLQLSFMVFGLLMGAMFPFYANFFVEWKEGALIWFVLGCLVAGGIMGAASYWLVNIILLRKLRCVSNIARAIEQGDLRQHIPLKSADVIGEIVDSVNSMSGQLRQLIGQICESSHQLSQMADQLRLLSRDVVDMLAGQRNSAGQFAEAVSDMSHVAKEMVALADNAAGVAQDACEESSHGALIVTEAIGGIETLESDVADGVEVIAKLDVHSERIGGVIDVIRSIAEQTNLLALNAAIEAARAGEQGRGFAVVADEVRTLASRTQESTKAIQQMIEMLQDETHEAVQVMRRADSKAKECVELIEQTAETIAMMKGTATTVNAMNSRMAGEIQRQHQVAEASRTSVTTLEQRTEDFVENAQELEAITDGLAHAAGVLAARVSHFKY